VDREAIEFAWDNERPHHSARVGAFRIERVNVTNERFLDFIDAGGYSDQRWWSADDWAWLQRDGIDQPRFWAHRDGAWWWRGMFEWIPLPASWPVYVSHAEASAFARWAGARLPTEAEFQRAAFGIPGGGERTHPWGDAPPSHAHGVFDFASWDPQPVGSHPAGRSAWGIDDLVGNGWEWTSTPFAPFPGFSAMPSYPEYSADFFD
jgi:gamma-glutamyl hercynylcysteine S-oxide synthase